MRGNPVPLKTLMNIFGMPSGSCRAPLGKMTPSGLEILLNTARLVYANDHNFFKPIETFFKVDIEERLNSSKCWKGLTYDADGY
jgi:4-hydroxy-tetrahydrodipicolinate synthase